MSVQSTIREKLSARLQPTRLEVINESHLHAGHRGAPGTGESHYRVLIEAPIFAGKTRLERHRLINAVLAAELKGKVHALAIAAYAPGEAVP
jgi:BolA family transcriptional regulator, general stress-responsive regulator